MDSFVMTRGESSIKHATLDAARYDRCRASGPSLISSQREVDHDQLRYLNAATKPVSCL
jgi:hypothetical protein